MNLDWYCLSSRWNDIGDHILSRHNPILHREQLLVVERPHDLKFVIYANNLAGTVIPLLTQFNSLSSLRKFEQSNKCPNIGINKSNKMQIY